MNSKTLLVLGAGIEQIAAIKIAQDMGIRVVAADGKAQAPGLHIADKGVSIDIRDVEAVTGLAQRERVNGIFCHAVEVSDTVALVAHCLELPGLNPEAALRATDKLSRYQCFEEHNVPCPRFRAAESLPCALEHAKELRFPLVVKPVDNAGARGVRKADQAKDLSAAYEWAVRFSRKRTVIIEEFLEGIEVSTESIVLDGHIITTGFADRNYDKKKKYEPYFIEDGHTIPSHLSPDEQCKVLQTVEKAIRALAINWGVAKGDVLIDADGPKIFEMAPRTSGGRFCTDMVPLATGVNILKPLIQMALGDPVDLETLKPRFRRGAAQRFLLPPAGRITALSGVDEAKMMTGIYDVFLSDELKVGGHVRPLTNHADRVGHVIAWGETRNQAVERAEAAVQAIRIVVE